jgi:subtilase family serine protease
MAYVIDDVREFTIQVIQEGFARIISYSVPSSAVPGSTISITATVRNDGAASDTIFAQVKEGTTVVGPMQVVDLSVGEEHTFEWNITMPNRTFEITIEAGHVE